MVSAFRRWASSDCPWRAGGARGAREPGGARKLGRARQAQQARARLTDKPEPGRVGDSGNQAEICNQDAAQAPSKQLGSVDASPMTSFATSDKRYSIEKLTPHIVKLLNVRGEAGNRPRRQVPLGLLLDEGPPWARARGPHQQLKQLSRCDQRARATGRLGVFQCSRQRLRITQQHSVLTDRKGCQVDIKPAMTPAFRDAPFKVSGGEGMEPAVPGVSLMVATVGGA